VEDTKSRVQKDEEIDEKFLTSRLDAEELPSAQLNGVAHAPFWPGVSFAILFINLYLIQPDTRHANPHGGLFWPTTKPTASWFRL